MRVARAKSDAADAGAEADEVGGYPVVFNGGFRRQLNDGRLDDLGLRHHCHRLSHRLSHNRLLFRRVCHVGSKGEGKAARGGGGCERARVGARAYDPTSIGIYIAL